MTLVTKKKNKNEKKNKNKNKNKNKTKQNKHHKQLELTRADLIIVVTGNRRREDMREAIIQFMKEVVKKYGHPLPCHMHATIRREDY